MAGVAVYPHQWKENQKNLILAFILNNSAGSMRYVQGLTSLTANITYPRLTILNPTNPLTSASELQYNQYIQKVDLIEDSSHPRAHIRLFQI